MLIVRPAETANEHARFCELAGLSTLTPGILERSQADAHWILEGDDGIQARCSLWWKSVPQLPGQRIGLIGHYAAYDTAAAISLLQLACKELARQGCTLAVGPMDGSTEQRYRLLSERGTEPPFFLEPDNPDDWPEHFTASGFTPLAHYYSTMHVGFGREDARISILEEHLAAEGVILRHFDMDSFEDELRTIYPLVASSFRANFLASPISEEDFLEMNRGLRPYIQPELVLLAERKGLLVGFAFAVPNWLQAQRGEAIDMLILKTLAVHPAYRGKGLSTLLSERLGTVAYELGYRRSIHALMHEKNISRTMSQTRGTQIIRRYTLFAQNLETKV
jgi:GNAT superfamily N-acetyltransferase